MVGDVIGSKCEPDEFLEGLLMADPYQGIVVRDDQGATTRVIWRMADSQRWSANPLSWHEVEIIDGDGNVKAVTGRRYKIGGHYQAAFFGFWACADVVIPQ